MERPSGDVHFKSLHHSAGLVSDNAASNHQSVRGRGIIRGAMTRHIAAFNQIRLLVDQFQNLWLENEFWQSAIEGARNQCGGPAD